MPVTHGVRGSSPLRTARKDNRKVILFLFYGLVVEVSRLNLSPSLYPLARVFSLSLPFLPLVTLSDLFHSRVPKGIKRHKAS